MKLLTCVDAEDMGEFLKKGKRYWVRHLAVDCVQVYLGGERYVVCGAFRFAASDA